MENMLQIKREFELEIWKNNENNLTFENKRCILKINSINGRWIKMFNLEELSLEFVEISELKTSKNLFGPVMYGTGVRM